MSVFRAKWALFFSMGVAALSLVGLGASASFTDSVSATQVINVGTMSFVITSADATSGSGTHHLTWVLKNSGSTISQLHTWTVTNDGTLPLTLTTISIKAQLGGLDPAPLGDDVTMNFAGFIYPVRTIETFSFFCASGCNLNPGDSFGPITNNFTGNLGNADEGQTITPTMTFNAIEWNGVGPSGGTPALAQS
jgi:predicted ribosomally synthesized peptide with SipW-like signal peptide